jgi:glucose-6-phosphate 1-dehydrogenase
MGGAPAVGYRTGKGIDPESQTETFVALKLFVDNWRWAGVPFYLRTGKRMPRRVSEIAVQFKTAPHLLFADTPTNDIEPNVLSMKIQPDEGITLKFSSKVPGQGQIRPVTMDFRYGSTFGVASPEAYERLLLDCMLGDGTLFTRRDEVEASWSLITPIHQGWAAGPPQPFPNYEAGDWGPDSADEFMARDGRAWRRV